MSRAKELHSITTDETRNVMVDMSAPLELTEVLTGLPDVQSSANLIITDVQINSSPLDINGKTVPLGQAVLFKASSSAAGQYNIEIVCTTDQGQTIEGSLILNVNNTEY